MRLVFCTDTLGRGGKERQMAIITRNLLAKGHEVFWITQKISNNNNYFEDYQLNPDLALRTKSNSFYTGAFPLRKQLKTLSPDLVMGWDIKSCFWLLIISPLSSWTFVNGSIQHGLRKNTFGHRFRTWIARLSPYVIANTNAGLRVNKMKPGPKRKVIYNAIDLPEIEDKQDRKERLKVLQEAFDENHHDFQGPIFLSVANLFKIKDIPTVIRALAKLNFDFRYLIAGEGPERESIYNVINDLNLQSKVVLLGRRQDIPRLLDACDIFINSSKGEGCSNAILEALAHGKQVVASRVGGTPEILPESLGAFFEFQNEESLINALIDVWPQSKNFNEQLKECHEHMSSFSNSAITPQFEETFQKWIKN